MFSALVPFCRSLPGLTALVLASTVTATPLRVSLDGLAAPDMATAAPTRPVPARYVVAELAPPVLDLDDAEIPLIPTHELPLAAAPDAAALGIPATHDDGLAAGRELREGLAADDSGVTPERRLGEFANPEAAPPAEGEDPFQAVSETEAPPPPVVALPTPDVESLRQQRLALEWVVVPMVLVAMVIAWRSSKRTTRHKTSHSGSGKISRNASRSSGRAATHASGAGAAGSASSSHHHDGSRRRGSRRSGQRAVTTSR